MLKRMVCLVLGLVLCVAFFAGEAGAQAQAQTVVEKLYQDLAALPVAERQKRLEEGALKEGPAVLLSTTPG